MQKTTTGIYLMADSKGMPIHMGLFQPEVQTSKGVDAIIQDLYRCAPSEALAVQLKHTYEDGTQKFGIILPFDNARIVSVHSIYQPSLGAIIPPEAEEIIRIHNFTRVVINPSKKKSMYIH